MSVAKNFKDKTTVNKNIKEEYNQSSLVQEQMKEFKKNTTGHRCWNAYLLNSKGKYRLAQVNKEK